MFLKIPNHFAIQFAKTSGKDGFLNYMSLQDFIEDHTLIGPFLFDKLDYLFRASYIFLINFVHCFLVLNLSAFKKHILDKIKRNSRIETQINVKEITN